MNEECFGACEEHIGKVQYVNVKDPNTEYDWGEYYYCEHAIKCDTDNGLVVTILDEMDLIKDHNPEPTDEEIREWGDSTFLPSLSGTEKLSFPITDKDLRIIVRAALAHWK